MGTFPRWRRRQWLVDSRHQVPFASVLLLQTVLIVAALGLYAYWVNHNLRGLTLGAIETEGGHLVSQRLNHAQQTFLLWLLLVIAVTVVVQVVFGVYTSHKLAGPIVKMKATLASLAEGREVPRISFRRGDYLDELADILNPALAACEARRQGLESVAAETSRSLQTLRTALEKRQLPSPGTELGTLRRSLAAALELLRRGATASERHP